MIQMVSSTIDWDRRNLILHQSTRTKEQNYCSEFYLLHKTLTRQDRKVDQSSLLKSLLADNNGPSEYVKEKFKDLVQQKLSEATQVQGDCLTL